MRYKRGFTLAEILIVLMVIGFIATMTIPTLMGGVTENQLKTGYKKAFNSISSIASMAKSTGKLPSTSTAANVQDLFITINNSLAVKGYVVTGSSEINSGTVITPASYVPCLTVGSSTLGEKGVTACGEGTTPSQIAGVGWIITEDNMAYNVVMGAASGACSSKLVVADQNSAATSKSKSCAVVIVDVNGLNKGPNMYDAQVGTAGGSNAAALTNFANSSVKMNTLTGDQFPIFIASNGATAGSEKLFVTGRIVGDAN